MIKSPYAPELVTPPAEALLTVGEAKLQCRVEAGETFEDSLFEGLIDAATAHLDGYSGVLGRCLINQVWRVWFDEGSDCMRLPFADASAVVVKWHDDDGVATTVDAADRSLLADHVGAYVRFASDYAAPSGVAELRGWSIEATCGYGAAADAVPPSIRQAALLLVAHWYANREAVNVGNIVTVMQLAVDSLIAPHRRVGL